MSTLQTLDRGLQALEFISDAQDGATVKSIADHMGIHRTIAHRIVATLHERHFVARTHTGAFRLGVSAAALSRKFAPQLLQAGRPVLRELSDTTGLTSVLSVGEENECVAVLVEEASNRGDGLRVSYQEGTRHPMDRGAAGLAILAIRPPSRDDLQEVLESRAMGYSMTQGELQRGAVGVSVGIVQSETMRMLDMEASVGVVSLGEIDVEMAASGSRRAADKLARLLMK